MEFGWLLAGAVNALLAGSQWLGRQAPALLATIAGLLAVVSLWRLGQSWRRRRRSSARVLWELQRERRSLKEELRLRLAEPSATSADAGGGPTMGAGEAFERDIEKVAETVLIEAGGRRGKAKALLRRRLNGNGAGNGHEKLNGSEAHYWRQLGALSLLDSTQDALAAYTRAADLAPDDAEAQMQLGVLHLRAGSLSAAEAAFRRQMRLGEGAEGGAARYRGGTMLGDVHAARGEHAEALAAYRAAQGELLTLLDSRPEDAVLQRDLSITCDRIAESLIASGDLEGGLESYRHGLEIAETLAVREPDSAARQHDLSVSHDRIGELLERMGDNDAALESYRRGLALAEALSARNPAAAQWQWDLSVSHERIGDLLLAKGQSEEALAHYRRGLAVAEALTKRDPWHTGWQRDLAVSFHKIGSIEADRGNDAEARELLERGRAIIARLDRIASQRAQWRQDLSRFDAALRSLQS